MPGHRCIAPGCKSGYDSCKEKYHFFSVPKDDDKLQQWKKAIPRKDEEIKPRQVVCERHFHEEDILWKRIMTDKNGTSLAEVVYKIPRLKEGAIPSIFPNCPKYLSNSLNPRKLPLIRRSSPKNPKADKKKDPKMNCSFTSDQSKVIGIIDSIEIFSFSKLQENINSIVFPNGWSRHDIPGKLIMFSFFIVKTKDILIENYVPTPILYKRVCLGFNLNVQCFVMNMSVNTDLFGSNKLNCSKDLEDILKQFDTSIICKGYKLKEKLLHSKTTYTDPAGNFRHIMCPLILNQNNDCKYCNKAIQTIMVNCYI